MGTEESPSVKRHRLTVEEYHRMGETGVLAPDARVELIQGEIIDMAPIGTRHAATVKRLSALLSKASAGRAIVSVQDPIRLDDASEPQPDLALVKPRADYYAHGHPTAADVLLIIEVADTSGAYDRHVKAPLYARHGVPEVWIVDLDERVVRFLRSPDGDRYTDITASETPRLTPIALLPGIALDLSDILG